MRFSDMQKSITFTSFCRGTSALLDSLSPSLCCLHPCHRKELWKVFQLCSNFIYLPSSSGLTIPPCASAEQETAPVTANPRGAGEFLWILWLTWNALDSHPVFPTISNQPLCLSPQYWQFSWHYRDKCMNSELKNQIQIFTLLYNWLICCPTFNSSLVLLWKALLGTFFYHFHISCWIQLGQDMELL